MQDEPEEFTYLHAILKDMRSVDFPNEARTAIIDELRRNPEKIYALSPHKVEEIIKDALVSARDCKLELTKQTRDGGKDIIGFDSNGGKFFVEVKRYARHRKIGVGLVRQFVGAMAIEGVQRGIFVTTSSFSGDAISVREALSSKPGWDLELRDFKDICSWLALFPKGLVDYAKLEDLLNARLYGYPKGSLASLLRE